MNVPGCGWTTPSHSKVIIYPEVFNVDDTYGEFPGTKPGDLIKMAFPDAVLDSAKLSITISEIIRDYFKKSPTLQGEIDEFLSRRMSNERLLRWNLMRISDNTSFRLHAHQNIEVIYVIRGAIYEVRLISEPPQRYFPVDQEDGPNLSTLDSLRFVSRKTMAASAGADSSTSTVSVDNEEGWYRHSRFLVNEKGSIHLSYTMEEGADLLVLWSGSHGNIPSESYPPHAAQAFAIPHCVIPYS